MNTSLVDCFHGSDYDNPKPCPPLCPVKQWPREMFRYDPLRGELVLRDTHRHLVEEHKRQRRAFRIYADQFPDGRYHGPGKPRSFEAVLAETL